MPGGLLKELRKERKKLAIVTHCGYQHRPNLLKFVFLLMVLIPFFLLNILLLHGCLGSCPAFRS
jgi:hypothetical protein